MWRDSGEVLVENTLFVLDGSRGGASQFSGLLVASGGLGCGQSGGTCVPDLDDGDQDIGTGIVNHFVAYMPAHNFKPIQLNNQSSNFRGSANNITSIKHPAAKSSSFTNFTGTNRHEGTSVDAVPNIFNGANSANICKRYLNGVLTNEPLWPWPMDERVKAAIDQARAMQADPKSPLLTGNSITREIESRFGPISAECRSS
jgi:hypothetical protein